VNDEWRRIARELILCTYCGAKPGKRCRRRVSRREYYHYIHDARMSPLLKVWLDGVKHGRKNPAKHLSGVAS